MSYLLDTVTIIRHFTDSGKIGKRAREILETKSGDQDRFMISVVSLMEILYLSEKHRISISLKETLKRLESSSLYMVVDLTPEILLVAETIDFAELHDRLILATAKWLDVPVISSDSKFFMVKKVEVIWN